MYFAKLPRGFSFFSTCQIIGRPLFRSVCSTSAERIKAMIVETDGTIYENLRSMEQELTFVVASGEFRNKNLEFGEAQQKTLGIRVRDGLYTNLGLLLSDQCPLL